jgi:hypothetical protein
MPPITPITPPAAPTAPTRTRSPEAIAAQRAFFNAALGKAAPQAPPAAAKSVVEAAAPRAPAPPVASTPDLDANAPQPSRLLRPGSLIDIKV